MPPSKAGARANGLQVNPADTIWLSQHKFQWLGERGEAVLGYGGQVFQRGGFTITEKTADGTEITRTYSVGTFVTVAINSQSDRLGEVSANSVAEIIGILEDQCGHCWVGLYYFWRWAQIHAGADVAGSEEGCPRVMAPTCAAEVFRQSENITAEAYNDSNASNAVYGRCGRFRELESAASLVKPVTVLPYLEVLQRYPDLDSTEALYAFEREFSEVEADTGARSDGFFYRYQFDHTAYAFTYDPAAFGGNIKLKLLSEEEQTMVDAFCGAGHVALAARMAGWAVSFGVDANADAAASFAANTMDFPGFPFNSGSAKPPFVRHCTVEQLLQEARQGKPLPKVGYLHCSPPCQELSQRKKEHLRRFTGATLMAIPKLAEALQPAFITLEEVPGFLVHQFPSDGFLVYKEAAKQMAAQRLSQSQVQQQQQSQPGQSQACGDEDESDDDDDDDDDTVAAAASREQANDEVEAELQQLNQASKAAGSVSKNKVVCHPCLLVVPQLLSLGYQVRLTFLNGVQYGVPQDRVRVFLFAAKLGYALPNPPVRRYQLPNSSKRKLADVKTACDLTLMPRGAEPATWWDTLTAAADALSPPDEELLPHVTVAEAVGDLPTVIASSSGGNGRAHQWRQQGQAEGQQQQHWGSSGHLLQATDGPSGLAGEVSSRGGVCGQQQAPDRMEEVEQQQETVTQAAARVRREALQVAARYKGRKHHQYGLQCAPYQPQNGVLLQQLPEPVSQLHPISAYAHWCRAPHWPGQGFRGFNPLGLLDHTYTGPTLSLPTDGNFLVKASGVVGTVLGHNCLCGSSVHFAEPRFSTTLERRRYQGVPDWVVYCGGHKSVNQQVGNAVPYLLAVEVAASVFQAATGVDGRRPPALVGPSPNGSGLPDEAQRQYRNWWDDKVLRSKCWREVVLWSRDALRPKLELALTATPDDSDQRVGSISRDRSKSSKRHKPNTAG